LKTNPPSRLIKLLFVVFFAVPLLTGCWDRLEIEDRAVVLAISIDTAAKATEQEEDEVSHYDGTFPAPTKSMIRVALQIALPGKIPLGPGESGGGGKGSGQTVWVVDEVGHTIDDALTNLQQQISGRLFFGHLRVIVVSDEVAKQEMQNLNDYLRRNPEVRRMAWMMVSKGNAEKLMKAAPQLERVPALYLMSTMDNAVRDGKFPANYVGMYWSNSMKKGQEAYLPYVMLKKEQNIELMGMAYFKKDELAGTTEPFEITVFMAIKGLNPAGYRGYVKLEGTSNIVTIYSTSRKSKLDVQIKNNRPYFTLSILIEVNLEEKLNEKFLVSNSRTLSEIQQSNQDAIKKAAESMIKDMQEKGTDIFGFGEYVRAKKPSYWNRQIKTKEKWQQSFKDISVEVRAVARVRRIGMKAK
jgi:spore germination protein KC